jgi:general secretion pathway protein G
MRRGAKKGFTLVEILIVVIILGILAAIVIPQFTQASTQARVSNLKTNLQTMRSQLLLYKMQHDNEAYPTNFVTQMTQYTNSAGTAVATPDATHTLGPYLQAIPANPMSSIATVRVVTDPTATFSCAADAGWYFNSGTGEFRADLTTSAINKTPDGTNYNDL